MDQKPSEQKEGFQRVRVVLASLILVFFAVASVSAFDIDNFSSMAVVLSNISGVILPQFLSLVLASLPIIVVISIIAFIVAFLDKILALIKF